MSQALALIPSPGILTNDHAVRLFIADMVRDIYPVEEIAERWGLVDVIGLRGWLKLHPGVDDEINRQKALHDADDNVLDRISHKSAHGLENGLVDIFAIGGDPNVAPRERLDAYKLASKLSGAEDHMKPREAAAAGTQANIQILFSGLPAQTITAVVTNQVPEITLATPVVADSPESPPESDEDVPEDEDV